MIGLNTLNSNSSFYTPANKVLEGNHPACQSVYPCLTLVNSTQLLTNEPILLKIYTLTVHDLRICTKEDNLCTNYFKGR